MNPTNPMNLSNQILEAWRINHRVNLMLLDAIPEAGMTSSLSTRGGRDVARQFAHMHNVRVMWLEVADKTLTKGLKKFDTKESPSKAELKKHHGASTEAMARLFERSAEAGGTLKGFTRGLIPALGYFLAHEGHHRGSILLTLKQTGHKVPTEIQYGIWEWAKI